MIPQKSVSKEYFGYKVKADSLLKLKDYPAAIVNYKLAYKSMGLSSLEDDIYNLACCLALSNQPDSAFRYLSVLTRDYHFSDARGIAADGDFSALHADKRWTKTLEAIQENKNRIEAKLNQPLIARIDSMKAEDQRWRNLWVKYKNKELDTVKYPAAYIHKHFAATDSLNYFVCKAIFSKYSFPDYDLVGRETSDNFWLLVQHQDAHPAFQDSVLKAMKTAVDKGLANGINYAYLLDRVRVNGGKPQVYGTQMILNESKTSFVPQPVEDEANLDERRRSIGLPPIKDYIKTMNERYHGSLKK